MKQEDVKAKLLALSDLCYSVRKKTPIPFDFEIKYDCNSQKKSVNGHKAVTIVHIPQDLWYCK